MISHGKLEITTAIGCQMSCRLCPQALLERRYAVRGGARVMEFDVFARCIASVPTGVKLSFSGFSEPWGNPRCTEMLLHAASRGHPVSVYSTLVGMTMRDFERIEHLAFDPFAVHLPDEARLARIPITAEYREVLSRVLSSFAPEARRRQIAASCHGPIHSGVRDLVPEGFFDAPAARGINFQMIDRAGHVDAPGLEHRWREGRIACDLGRRQLNNNVLLPDGSVALCCMDYGLEHVLGNLLAGDYASLFSSPAYEAVLSALDDERLPFLCRRCHRAVPWGAPYAVLGPPAGGEGKERAFARRIAERMGAGGVAEFGAGVSLEPPEGESRRAVLFVPDARGHVADDACLAALRRSMRRSPAAVLCLPDSSSGERGGAEARLRDAGLRVEFSGESGIAADGRADGLVVLAGDGAVPLQPAPANFRVVALMGAYNEADIVGEAIADLIRQGVEVYCIDNWSEDATHEIARGFLGRGVIGIERFPADGPAPIFDWAAMLRRKAELAWELGADWAIHVDADELRESPWEGVNLRDALHRVDREGYTCVDHTTLVFRPTQGEERRGRSVREAFLRFFRSSHGGDFPRLPLREAFPYFEFGSSFGSFLRRGAWKCLPHPVDLASSGGHEARFEGVRVYPYKFLLLHYPLRFQRQAERKVFVERAQRWGPIERAMGWHHQYDALQPGKRFVWDAETLVRFDRDFYRRFLIERLSGIGLRGSPS